MRFFKRQLIDWRAIRARIIGETGDYITECLLNPDMAVRIPALPADEARWPRDFAETFWRNVLKY